MMAASALPNPVTRGELNVEATATATLPIVVLDGLLRCNATCYKHVNCCQPPLRQLMQLQQHLSKPANLLRLCNCCSKLAEWENLACGRS